MFCFARSFLGLSKEAAQKKWAVDFKVLKREQWPANDKEGNPIGNVAWRSTGRPATVCQSHGNTPCGIFAQLNT